MCLVGLVVRRYNNYIDFLILLIPTPLVSALSLLFVHCKKCIYRYIFYGSYARYNYKAV